MTVPLSRLRQRARALFAWESGVLAATVLAGGLWWWSQPLVRLPRLLPRLPEDVVLVVLYRDTAEQDVLSRALDAFLASAVPALPDRVPPARALLLVESGGKLLPVQLFFPRDVAETDQGIRWRGYRLVGSPEAVERVTSGLLAPSSARRPRTVALLASAEPHVVLVRQTFLAKRYPFLQDVLHGEWDAFAWSVSPPGADFASIGRQHLSLRIHHEWRDQPLGDARALLPPSLSPPAAVIDGLPGQLLFPDTLPPILEALKDVSGVKKEIAELQTFFGQRAVTVVLGDAAGQPTLTLVLPLAGEDARAAEELVTALFTKRLQQIHAVTETVRGTKGTLIRHLKPATDSRYLVTEQRDGVLLLRAPCGLRVPDGSGVSCEDSSSKQQPVTAAPGAPAAGLWDLVALVGRGFLVVGTHQPTVEEVFRALGEQPEEKVERSVSRLFLDMERLRRFPLTGAVLTRFSPTLRSFVTRLQTANFTLVPTDGGIEVQATVSLGAER